MAGSQRVEVPEHFLGTEIPADLRTTLNFHSRHLDEGDARSLIAAALASWVISSTARTAMPKT